MPLVFQYGSNCNAERLNYPTRLNGHAQDRGGAYTFEDFEIAFDVWSDSNGCAASDLIPMPGRKVWGVLYEIPDDFIRGKRADGRRTLAQIEGPRYKEKPIRVCDKNKNVVEEPVTTFLVKPRKRGEGLWTSVEYVEHIVNGLRAHDIPEEYVQHVIDVAVETNKRAELSAADQIRLIEQLRSAFSNAKQSNPTPMNPLNYYSLEDYLFSDVTRAFIERGYLTAEEFFSIVIWKAERAKSRIKKKLLPRGTDLATVV